MDRGPLLTSAIIFYLAIGAAIFEVLEEPHWKEAKKKYYTEKLHLLAKFPCLGQEGLDEILQVRRRFAPRAPDAGSSPGRVAGPPLAARGDPRPRGLSHHGFGCRDLSFTRGPRCRLGPQFVQRALRVEPRAKRAPPSGQGGPWDGGKR